MTSQAMKILSFEALSVILKTTPGYLKIAANRLYEKGQDEYKGYRLIKVGRNWIAIQHREDEEVEIHG